MSVFGIAPELTCGVNYPTKIRVATCETGYQAGNHDAGRADTFNDSLASDVSDFPGLRGDQDAQQLRDQREQVGEAVRAGTEHDEGEPGPRNVLLALHVPVGGDEDLEARPARHAE